METAFNGMPYAYSWYLDIVALGEWDALVYDDYAAVFPLPVRTRFFRKEVYQPLFTQQLGLFSKQQDQELLMTFLQKLQLQYKRFRLHLNTENGIGPLPVEQHIRYTYHIDLQKEYNGIRDNYSSQTIRNLKTAHKNNFRIQDKQEVSTLIELRRKWLRLMLQENKQKEKDTLRLERVLTALQQHNKGFVRTICNAHDEVQAAAFFAQSNGKLIYLSAVSTDTGKQQQAMSFLIDVTLQEFAGTALLFDFEGSMLEGLARYYAGFGAVQRPYLQIKNS